jgi:uncharacterized protein (TIGR03435 family)
MRRRFVLPGLLLLFATFGTAAVTVGSPAPPIKLDQLIPDQPVANAELGALAGKAVVLEFWATWCAPCIDAIPHLNELVEDLKGKPIQFLSITDENPELIASFLKKRPIAGWVGIDRKKATQKAYGFIGIPQTVLIDAAGKVAAITHPAMLRPSHLEDLLAGKPVSLPRPMAGTTVVSRVDDGGKPAILDVLIRPAAGGGSMMSRSKAKLTMTNASLRTLLGSAYGIDYDRIEGEPVNSTDRYDVSITFPGAGSETLDQFLRQMLTTAFHIQVERETRETDVLVIKAPEGKSVTLTTTASTGGSMTSMGNGQLKVIGGPIESLAHLLSGAVHKPVIDETGLPGKYDIILKYDSKAPESAMDAVREQLGLTIEPARRPVEFLIVK